MAQPGTEWNYSVGMDVLGRLIEAVSGMSFGEFLRERLFDPLGMTDTGFYVPDSKVERFAANYGPAEGGGMTLLDDPQTSAYRKPPALEMGGAGLVGTVGDYLRFAQMLANKGEFQGTRILGRKTVEFMTSNHLTPVFPDDPMTSLRTWLGGPRQWGVGFGITGSVVTNPATSGLPVSKGTFSWGGAATTGFGMTSEPQSLATEASETWGIGYPCIGDPHHEIRGALQERGLLGVFANPDYGHLGSRPWASHPKGYFQPGVLAVAREGRVLYRWRCRPVRQNMSGAGQRPTSQYVWSG